MKILNILIAGAVTIPMMAAVPVMADDFNLSSDIEAVLEVDAEARTCSINSEELEIVLTTNDNATATNSETIVVEQSGPTDWSLTGLSETGPASLGSASIALDGSLNDLTTTLTSGDVDTRVNGSLDDRQVTVTATMNADGTFVSGTYRTETTLSCLPEGGFYNPDGDDGGSDCNNGGGNGGEGCSPGKGNGANNDED